ncbi:MAG: glycosyltransferase, partial [Opitutales bacterium]
DAGAFAERYRGRVAELSARVVAMGQKGVEFLNTVYGVPLNKIDLIPHAIPDVSFSEPATYKERFGVEGKTVLLTFGLLSPNKGIDCAIRALPAIVRKYPNVVYLVLGATHPHLLAREGESYRLSLQRLAEACGVENHVIFYNRFVSIDELTEFIGAADIYITPYLNEAQITSGTLAYSFGAGKAVVSTPYWHASELLADGRGVLVPFGDSEAIAREVIALLGDDKRRHAMCKAAYARGREVTWPRVAKRYMEAFNTARSGLESSPKKFFASRTLSREPYQLPPLNLNHLLHLTDNTGIFQHAIFNVPNYDHGYCTDDNARAYILTALLDELGEAKSRPRPRMAACYLGFLWHAFNPPLNRFRNFMSFDRRWLEEQGSEDSHARALWALGTALGSAADEGHRRLAACLFEQALPPVLEFTSPRAWAFTLIAIQEYMKRFAGDRTAARIRGELMERLLELYRKTAGDDWPWFEDSVNYDNPKLSHALVISGYWTQNKEAFDVGLKTLRWLVDIQTAPSGCFSPVGSNGFFPRGKEKARFDQQPLEAHAMVSACLEAFRLTRDKLWWREAVRAFEWFLGRNDLGTPLYDPATGGCRDGLHPDRVNENFGAESSLSFYMSQVEMRLAQRALHALEDREATDPGNDPGPSDAPGQRPST